MACYVYKNNQFEIYGIFSKDIIRTIEFASRVCYDSNYKTTDDSWKKYIGARVKSGHESVIEHGLISFIVNSEFVENTFAVAIAKSNSLIHYVCENGWDPRFPFKHQVILSGNIKMWRDLFKWLIAHDFLNCPEFRIIFGIFKEFDASCEGIFTSDFGKYCFQPESLLNGTVSFINTKDDSIGIARNFVKDWSKVPVKTFRDYELVYSQRPPIVTTSPLGEPVIGNDIGIEQRLINLDNPITELFVVDGANKDGDNIVPNYILAFAIDHIKDLSSVTWVVKMPRIVTQQESRHRINSISQRSQRYVDESESFEGFYCPPAVDDTKKYKVGNRKLSYVDITNILMSFYSAMTSDGIPKEDARMILPNCIYSMMVVTKPLHTLDHYFKERCSLAAQKEIREPAIAMKEYINHSFNKLLTVPLFK